MANVMFDLETLGTGSDTMILTISAVEFNPDTGATKRKFYEKVDIDSYKSYTGLFTMDGSTLTWWMTTAPEEARKEAFTGQRQNIKNVFSNLLAWINLIGDIIPWSHGSCFDIPILSHHFRVFDIKEPWKFWNVRDTRTLYSMAGVDLKTLAPSEAAKEYPEHHAVGDCLKQIEGVRKSYEILNSLETPKEDLPRPLKRLKRLTKK